MLIRTYLRTVLNDVFKNNVICSVLSKIVNFYFNLFTNHSRAIKFNQNLPILEVERKKQIFFQSVTGDKIDCK